MGERDGEPAEREQPGTLGKRKKTGESAERQQPKEFSGDWEGAGWDEAIEAAERMNDPMKDKHRLDEDLDEAKAFRPLEHLDRPDPEP
jgi:hypothetical protein